MPTKREALNALGHVYWKKSKFADSKKCFETSLELDESDREVLRNLSMVCRQIPTDDAEARKANFAKSI